MDSTMLSGRPTNVLASPVKKRKRSTSHHPQAGDLLPPSPPESHRKRQRHYDALREPFAPSFDDEARMEIDEGPISSPEPVRSTKGASTNVNNRRKGHVDRDRIFLPHSSMLDESASASGEVIDRLKTLSRRLPFSVPPSPTKAVTLPEAHLDSDEEMNKDNPFYSKRGEIRTPKRVEKPDRMTYVFRGKKVTYDVPFDALLAPADDDDPFPAPAPRLLFPTPSSPETPRRLNMVPKTPERGAGAGRSRLEETKRRMHDMMVMGLLTPAQEDARRRRQRQEQSS